MLEGIVQDLVDLILQSMELPSPIIAEIPPEPAHHTPTTELPFNGTIPLNLLPAKSHVSADINPSARLPNHQYVWPHHDVTRKIHPGHRDVASNSWVRGIVMGGG